MERGTETSAGLRLKLWQWSQGFTYWIRQPGGAPGAEARGTPPETPSASQGPTPEVSPMQSPTAAQAAEASSPFLRCNGGPVGGPVGGLEALCKTPAAACMLHTKECCCYCRPDACTAVPRELMTSGMEEKVAWFEQ